MASRYYWFYFEDGYRCCAKGFSKTERAHLEKAHGKMIGSFVA